MASGSIQSSEAYATEDAPDNLFLRDLMTVNQNPERTESQAGGSSFSSESLSSNRFLNESLSVLQQAVRMTIVNKKIMDQSIGSEDSNERKKSL